MPDSQMGYSPAASNRDTETVYPPMGAAPGSPGGVVDQESRATNTDTTGTSVAGIGAALPGGSVADVIPWAGSGQAGGSTGPGPLTWSGYAVNAAHEQQYGYGQGTPDTEAVYGGTKPVAPITPSSPYPWIPVSTLLSTTLDTQVGGGSAVTAGLGTPPAYRAPTAGVGASIKDTTLTDIMGNQVAAMPLTSAAYAALNIDTSYVGAPSAPASLSTQVDAFATTTVAPVYATRQGIVPSTLAVYDTTSSQALVLNTDYTVTTALNGPKTSLYITLIHVSKWTTGDAITMTYQYGSPQYYDSNLPPAVAQANLDVLQLSLVPAQLTGWGVTTAASALTVVDVTQGNATLVYNTDYTVQTVTEPFTPGGTYAETPRITYAISWRPQSTVAKLGDTITVAYSFATSVPTAPSLGGTTVQTDNIATFNATPAALSRTGIVTPPAALQVVNNQAGANFGKTLVLNVDYNVSITGTGSTLTYSVVRLAGSTASALNDNVRVSYSYGNAAYFTTGPLVPGDKGIFVPFGPPAGTTNVDYYLVQSTDLGTQYVPASGQPAMYGQPSTSGGATSGQPVYQVDTFTGAFNSGAPNTLAKSGIVVAPGQLIVRDLTSTEKDPLQPGGTVLIYGYDYTVTATGVGPWLTYQVQRIATSQNSSNGDTITVSYWYDQMGASPLTSVADAVTTVARVAALHNADIATPPRNLIVWDTTVSRALAYGLDFTATATGLGPAQTVQITTIAGGPANAGASDALVVYYSYGVVMATVFSQGLPANKAGIYLPAGSQRSIGQGVQLSVAAGNRAGLGPFSSWSDYVTPLNYNAPQPGAQGTIISGTGALDGRNSINPIYKPDGTVKAGTGLGV